MLPGFTGFYLVLADCYRVLPGFVCLAGNWVRPAFMDRYWVSTWPASPAGGCHWWLGRGGRGLRSCRVEEALRLDSLRRRCSQWTDGRTRAPLYWPSLVEPSVSFRIRHWSLHCLYCPFCLFAFRFRFRFWFSLLLLFSPTVDCVSLSIHPLCLFPFFFSFLFIYFFFLASRWPPFCVVLSGAISAVCPQIRRQKKKKKATPSVPEESTSSFREGVGKLPNWQTVVCVCVCVCVRFYWFLLGFTGFYWVLPGFIGCYRVFTGLYLVLLSFTGVQLGLNRFYWVLPSFTEFHRV